MVTNMTWHFELVDISRGVHHDVTGAVIVTEYTVTATATQAWYPGGDDSHPKWQQKCMSHLLIVHAPPCSLVILSTPGSLTHTAPSHVEVPFQTSVVCQCLVSRSVWREGHCHCQAGKEIKVRKDKDLTLQYFLAPHSQCHVYVM